LGLSSLIRTGGLVLAAAAALCACDGGGDPVQQALQEASAANQAAQVRTGTVSTAAPATGRPGASPDDQALVARMITQQRAGVTLADTALAQSADPDVRRMAQALRDRQTRDIAELQAWTAAPD
jgi:uncharacterized protein (DUF305 family)